MTRRTRLLPFLTYPIHFCISFVFSLPPSLPTYLFSVRQSCFLRSKVRARVGECSIFSRQNAAEFPKGERGREGGREGGLIK